MTILLEIEESRADFVMQLLGHFLYVKVQPLTSQRTQVLEDLKEAVENMKLVKAGKLKPRLAKELLDEL